MFFNRTKVYSDDWQKLNVVILQISGVLSLLSSIAVSLVLMQQYVNDSERQIFELDTAAKIISLHVYNYDIQATKSVASALLHYDFILNVEVIANNGYTIYTSDIKTIKNWVLHEQPLHVAGKNDKIGVLKIWRKSFSFLEIAFYAVVVAIFVFLVVFFPCYVIVTYYIQLFVLKPIEQLIEATDQTLKTGVPVKARLSDRTYLGEFAKRFNTMQEKLVEVQSDVTEQAEVLEKVLIDSHQAVRFFKSNDEIRDFNSQDGAEDIFYGIPLIPFTCPEKFKTYALKESPLIREIQSSKNTSITNCLDSHSYLYELEILGPKNMLRTIVATTIYGEGLAYIVSDVSLIRKMQTETLQARKIESLGALTSGIAHDINNILAIILGNLEVVKYRYESDLYIQERINTSLIAGANASKIIRALLNFSRQGVEQGTIFCLDKMLVDLMPLLKSSLEPNMRITLNAECDLYIRVSRSELSTAIINMVINARDAMPNGGLIIISAKKEFDDTFNLELNEFHNRVVLSVIDSGHGIPTELMTRIGDPFFTTKKLGKGTGMGLALIHSFCKRFQGRLNYRNNVSEGATFSLSFPESIMIKNDIQEAIRGEKKLLSGHVLLVDDEIELLKVLSEYLIFIGLTVSVASNLVELSQCIEEHKQFDLVITDYSLHDCTGLDVIKTVRDHQIYCPAALISGHVRNISDLSNGETIFEEILHKPIKLDVLYHKVEAILSRQLNNKVGKVI